MDNETEMPTAEMPTFTMENYLREHTSTMMVQEAHPIDEDILDTVCDSKLGPVLLEHDLALIQAVAVREVLPDQRSSDNTDHEHWITVHPSSDDIDLFEVTNGRDRQGRLHYYQVGSRSFYELLTLAYQRYDSVSYVKVEDIPDIVEAHTRQYLRDVHGYEGNFDEREPTLCSAQNDEHRLRDKEPDNAHYAFTDARGLVIEEGTHGRQHDVDTLVAALERKEIRSELTDSGDWNEERAVRFLTTNYCTSEERAATAFERYQE